MTGFLLLTNDAAGSADDDELGTVARALEAGGPIEVASPDSGGPLDDTLRAHDGRVVVVAGGDGSLHLVVERLHALGLAQDVPIGLVPLGTGNDFARGVGVSLDPAEAAASIARLPADAARPVDLITHADGVVVNAAHAGVGASASERAAAMKEDLGAIAYPLGALMAGVTEAGWNLTVTVDDREVHHGPTLMVGVGNGPSIGGGTLLCPDAVVDDGLLDVVVATGVALTGRAAFAAALRTGTHTDRRDVISLRGTQVRISGDPVAHVEDGELSEPMPSRAYRLVPGAWRLLTERR